MLSIADLLNPEPLVDAHAEVTALENIFSSLSEGPVLVPSPVRRHLKYALEAWSNPPNHVLHSHARHLPPPIQTVIEHDVQITRKTTVSTLYRYPQETSVEYPETDGDKPVGHLFYVNPDNWVLPWNDFVYSRGAPDGGSKTGSFSYCSLLVDHTGVMVPCKIRHATCRCKIISLILPALMNYLKVRESKPARWQITTHSGVQNTPQPVGKTLNSVLPMNARRVWTGHHPSATFSLKHLHMLLQSNGLAAAALQTS